MPNTAPAPKITRAAAQRGRSVVRLANLETNAQPRTTARNIEKMPATLADPASVKDYTVAEVAIQNQSILPTDGCKVRRAGEIT